MRDATPGVPARSPGGADLSPSEKLVCEWEARHDVAARGRQADPAAALQRYLTQSRIEEFRRHADHPAQAAAPRPGPRRRRRDEFTIQHPLAASLLRWGEDPR